MKTSLLSPLAATLALQASLLGQVVPEQLSYQGHVAVNGNEFAGEGHFKFALINQNGSVSHWSNDGTSAAGSEPTDSVSLSVLDGLYSVALGDNSQTNMIVIPPDVFTNSHVNLRIWFDDGTNGFQQLAPDQPVLSVGYAMMADQVPNGSITEQKLAPGIISAASLAPNSVNSGHIIDGEVKTPDIADNAVNSDKLADIITLGGGAASGHLDIWDAPNAVRAFEMNGLQHYFSTYGKDGKERIRLWGNDYGQVRLHDDVQQTLTAWLSAGNDGILKPQLLLNSADGSARAELKGEDLAGNLYLYGSEERNPDGSGGPSILRAVLYGDEGSGVGALSLRNMGGSSRLRLYGGPQGRADFLSEAGSTTLKLSGGNTAGSLWLYNNAGQANVGLWSWDNEEGVVSVRNKFGDETVYLWGRDSSDADGGQIGLKESDGTETLTLWASEVAGNGAQIIMRKSDGTASIILDADQGGSSRITTDVIQINGADLSEHFDITTPDIDPEPGMLVCIDPNDPGKLVISSKAYDRTAAGIISGAGGVRPGLLMSQKGTLAYGEHPVALTGRVYCNVDASAAPIQPGDLITTSDIPGHGMKALDHDKSQGAIIGKAMTRLDEGRGQVLVLVSLQ